MAHPRQESYKGKRFETSERYSYLLEELKLSEEPVDIQSGFFKGAWYHIWGEAIQMNVNFEYDRSRKALETLPRLQGVTYAERTVSFPYGSARYLRMTLDGVFDFEISTYPTVSFGLRELFAGMFSLWNGEGLDSVQLLDYNGNFFRKQAELSDFNYGMAYGWSEADQRLAGQK